MSPRSPADAASARIGTNYYWDAQDRLVKATHLAGTVTNTFTWEYDYRTRRIGLSNSHGVLASGAGATTDQPAVTAGHEAFIFSGGLSVAEHHRGATTTALLAPPTVTFLRGPDMGGGVGGMLYSQRGTASASPKFVISNGRGDIVAQSSAATAFTWTASYETAGKRAKTTSTNADRQRGNSKEEDTRLGLLNEGFRYRDTETMVWLSRDPAGFVDGPNLYAYVRQNPWSKFDPLGLMDLSAVYYVNPIVPISNEERSARLAEVLDHNERVGKAFADGPRQMKESIQNLPKLPGALKEIANDPAKGVAALKAAGEHMATSEGQGELYFGLLTGGAILKALSRVRAAAAAPAAPPILSPKKQLIVNEETIAKALEGSTMRTTQPAVSRPVVENYVRRLEDGDTPPPISVDGDIIVEGNHRYVAGRVFGQEPPTKPGSVSPSQVPKAKPVQEIQVKEEDFGNR